MNTTISLVNFGEHLITRDTGTNIREAILTEIKNNNKVILDFNEVKFLSRHCADEVFGKLVSEIGIENLKEHITIKNTDEFITTLIKYVISNRII